MGQKNVDVDLIFNDGERLVPFLSHDSGELIRHYSSHRFFKKIIIKDIKACDLKDISILDLGFGTGYASYLYANIQQTATVKSIDVSGDSLEWAKNNYYNEKIDYEICDAEKFLKKKETYSYIVTRHVLEHINNGLDIIKEHKFTNRLCINVPYNEGVGNVYHLLTGITEKDFPKYKNVEFFYEDLNGITYSEIPKHTHINSIICIASKDGMPKVGSYFTFPLGAGTAEELFKELSSDNFNFVKNILEILDIRTQQAIKAEEIGTKYRVLEKQYNNTAKEVGSLGESVSDLKKELNAVYDSKRWRIASKAAKISHHIVGRKK
jgi:SAM-dependent methyltransferase